MTGSDRTVVRSATYVGIAIGVFVSALAALPEPVPPTTADGALPETAFAIVGVKVFDGEAFRSGQDVRIEDGRIRNVGFGWQMTSDGMQGGSSTARLSVESGALRVEGEVAAGFPFPWAGAIYFPGARPMQPVDFSDRETLRFRTRGDGRTYMVMLFGADVNAAVPASVPFTASTAWTEVEIPLARFPTSAPGIIGGLAFVAQAPPLGAFAFAIDDVEIR